MTTILTQVKELKFAEARRSFYAKTCKFRYKDEFGEEISVEPENILGAIEAASGLEKVCQSLKDKGIKGEQELRNISETCGIKNSFWSPRLLEAERFSGVSLTDIPKRWDKFVEDKRAELNQMKIDQDLAEQRHYDKIRQEANSPEGIRKSACQTHTLVELATKAIARERAAAKHSGIVDKAKLYDAGQAIHGYGQQLEKLKAGYKAKTGQTWSPSMCKNAGGAR